MGSSEYVVPVICAEPRPIPRKALVTKSPRLPLAIVTLKGRIATFSSRLSAQSCSIKRAHCKRPTSAKQQQR
jgi:hypothetical protein